MSYSKWIENNKKRNSYSISHCKKCKRHSDDMIDGFCHSCLEEEENWEDFAIKMFIQFGFNVKSITDVYIIRNSNILGNILYKVVYSEDGRIDQSTEEYIRSEFVRINNLLTDKIVTK